MKQIKESDWKLISKLKDRALDRYCRRVLNEICEKITTDKKSNHEIYIEIYQLTKDRDKLLASAFDDHSRSNATLELIYWKRLDLINESDFSEFSADTQQIVNSALQMNNED